MTRIAIPMPHSRDLQYGERAVAQYERAVALLGGEPVRVPLDRSLAEVRTIIENCQGVLLPGSNADVDPAKFHQERSAHSAVADARREDVDWLLLDHAYAQRKPVLGICYGLQSLNVYRRGSLVQHIPEFLPEATRKRVNHEAGGKVAVAHSVEIEWQSKLAAILRNGSLRHGREGRGFRSEPALSEQSASKGASGTATEKVVADTPGLMLHVNSSHHQSADAVGDGLRIVARCPEDGIVEALEGTSADHFVLSVQWHPERSVEDDEASRVIFRALIETAEQRHDAVPRP